jgi:DNA replication protein DnaC
LPFEKTIEEYDFTFNPNPDKRLLMSLFDLDFLIRHENVIFLGPPGVGKTHLATALAIKACYFGVSIYFTTLADLIVKLKKDAESARKGKGRRYYSPLLQKRSGGGGRARLYAAFAGRSASFFPIRFLPL